VEGLGFNFIPLQIRRFSPSNCKLMKNGTCPWAEYCRIYFVKFEYSSIDAEMWKFRYRVLTKHLRDLASYKALYELSRRYEPSKIIEYVDRGYGFRITIDMRNAEVYDESENDVNVEPVREPTILEVRAKTDRGINTLLMVE